MFLLHLLSHPNPYIGYGVHAPHLQKELAVLAGSGAFLLQSIDLGNPGEFESVCALLTDMLPRISIEVGEVREGRQPASGC